MSVGKSAVRIQAEQVLNNDQIAELKGAFSLFDQDGDGTISTDELGIIFRSIGQNPTDEELDQMIAEVDDDNNGCCEFDEFLLLMSKNMKNESNIDDEMLEVFKMFDASGKGYISNLDLKKMMTETYKTDLSIEDINQLFIETD